MSIERKDDHDHEGWIEEKDLTPVETTFLTVLVWLDKRLRIVDYLELLETLYYRVNLQMPKSHTEQYNLDNKFWYWYPLYSLGFFSTLAYVVAAISGALLGFYYSPSAAAGACDIEAATVSYCTVAGIMTDLNFGFMLRSLHRWSAQVMTAAVFLHMLRVYFTGAYKEPREVNWLIGIILLSLTMVFGYTGYLLPWDQLAFWAGQIGVEMSLSIPLIGEWVAQLMFGGFSLGQATLQRMYILHVFLLPFVVTAVIGLHLALVWMQGIAEPHRTMSEDTNDDAARTDGTGIVPPDDETPTWRERKERTTGLSRLTYEYFERSRREDQDLREESDYVERDVLAFPVWPHELIRNLALTSFFVGMIFFLSATLPPHLGAPANPSQTPPIILPDWYLYWSFGLLKLGPLNPDLAIIGGEKLLADRTYGVLANVVVVGFIAIVPFLNKGARGAPSSSRSGRPSA